MIAIERDNLVVMMEAGYIYLAMRKYGEAKSVFEGVAVLAPKSEIPLVAVGNVYFSKRQYAQAIGYYKRALVLLPESAFAKAYLGESLLFSGQKETAMRLLGEAAKSDTDGSTGRFAQSLLALVHQGFDPYSLAKVKNEPSYEKETV